MAISRMQEPQQIQSGIGSLQDPRQGYFLGKLVKKAGRAVKKIVKSPLGKAALIAGGGYLLGGGLGAGGFKFGTLGSRLGLGSMNAGKFAFDGPLAGLVSKGGKFDMGRTALTGLGAASLALPFMGGGGGDDDDGDSVVEQIDPRYQVQRAKNFYSGQGDAGVGLNFMPQKKYVQGNFYQPAADGGRIGYSLGSLVRGSGMAQPVSASMSEGDAPVMPSSGMGGMLSTLINNNPQLFKNVSGQNNSSSSPMPSSGMGGMFSKFFSNPRMYNQYFRDKEDFIDENFNDIDDREEVAMGGRIRRAEGGLMDLGGMEKDYRAEGGFVPIGREEKADDVPARLSVNEFVFTADAVRNAGGGDIDKGAEVMENMMKNLEAGGQVSKDSQGLEGAQAMYDQQQMLQSRME